MTIGLICAIEPERAHLGRELTRARSELIGHARFDSGQLDGHDVVLVGGGMGKVNAAVVATLLLDRFRCRAIVFSGVAGGLDPALNIGDIVVADRAIHHDAGVIEADGLRLYQAGHVPFINPTEDLGYRVDPQLDARVRDRLAGFPLPPVSRAAGGAGGAPVIAHGAVLTGDQFLHDERTRERLYADLGGCAVDMEGAAVAQVCAAFGLPWLLIRALSDLAGRDSRFDFAAFVDEVAASSAAILRHLLPVL
ncbi:5'-methylthioadenosine/S-adenosylhomocysteine nucleosidase [Mycolicibacterium vanbaalenii]|uniref:adenosylhomocysteine nucleosidase n=1 Tax=Mycolicibacterium vanbaalenii TaxID=110539 RepID=A0A5S9QMF3_MYCVN|nr:5'-methylthioadenosine/adenosylhomocysteine nucleosidase [Mycolicibacterium vanbaalenii]CAA0120179.1 5'-methylthioadenosine/S-adenosylhomocysteine nucleosidase [Mycolicibacterium vanbaalenii]